jgi:gamma-D-glutamyl-L-lysine dipeptidyl-peptidase
MNQGICLLTVIPMRKEPDHRSEMVSQLLFGESATILEEKDGWQKVESHFDEYTGWIEDQTIQPGVEIQPGQRGKTLAEPFTLAFTNSHPILLPAGSEIPETGEESSFSLANRIFKLSKPPSEVDLSIPSTSMKFLHAPYLWGGRTAAGIDCSGFVQLVYKIHGKSLPRDASEQVTAGQQIQSNTETLQSDLFFFGINPEKISHVGIFLGNNRIIHASKFVRIDTVDEKGIFNNDMKKYTHQLQQIRRVTG